MVAAAERGFCFAALPRDDRQIVVIDAASGETIVFLADAELEPRAGSWANYPMTVARRIARNFPGATRGADIALISDLPPAAGMGSSSALMTGVFLVLSEVNNLTARDDYWHHISSNLDLAGYLGSIENGQGFGSLEGDRGVGTFGGSEDHTAILCAESNCISQYAYAPIEFEKIILLPPGYVFLVGASGAAAEKTGAALEKYNSVARLATALLDLWRRRTGRDDASLAGALDSSPDAAERLAAMLESPGGAGIDVRCLRENDAGAAAARSARGAGAWPAVLAGGGTPPPPADGDEADRARATGLAGAALLARLRHFMIESGEIVPQASEALLAGELEAFGRLADRSQQAAVQLLGNQTPETIYLATAARRLGAAAASSFGAGFGGSVWALVETAAADDLLAEWADGYFAEFPQHARRAAFFATAAGPAAFRVC
jgi:galactokinase